MSSATPWEFLGMASGTHPALSVLVLLALVTLAPVYGYLVARERAARDQRGHLHVQDDTVDRLRRQGLI